LKISTHIKDQGNDFEFCQEQPDCVQRGFAPRCSDQLCRECVCKFVPDHNQAADNDNGEADDNNTQGYHDSAEANGSGSDNASKANNFVEDDSKTDNDRLPDNRETDRAGKDRKARKNGEA
jgi:hypothetical protein